MTTALHNEIEYIADILRLTKKEREHLLEGIEGIVSHGESIESHFDYVGCGSYKEVFELSDRFVLKFYGADNPTEKEQDNIYDAAENGFGDMFAATYYFDLSEENYHPYAEFLDEIDNPDYDPEQDESPDNDPYMQVQFYGFCIQPLCHEDNEAIGFTISSREEYVKDVVIPGVSYDKIQKACIEKGHWLHAIAAKYGAQYLNDFLDFIWEYNICDLHSGNLGFFLNENGEYLPKIIDWQS